MKTLEELKSKFDEFYEISDSCVDTHPWAVCIAMHEYARNTYPNDPYIPFSETLSHTERVFSVTGDVIHFLEQVKKLGFYKSPHGVNLSQEGEEELKKATGQVYGKLWSKFSLEDLTEGTFNWLKERLTLNNFDLSYFEGKKAIDIGCGSGRYSLALRKLGCASVVGIDYGDSGLATAQKILDATKMDNLSFQKASVLDVPFD